MDFGKALETLKQGKRVARAGWKCKGMWLALVRSFTSLDPSAPHAGAEPYWSISLVGPKPQEFGAKKLLPWIGLKTADNHFVPWTAPQTDILAEDWTEEL